MNLLKEYIRQVLTEIMYHGTAVPRFVRRCGKDICLVDNPKIAKTYAHNAYLSRPERNLALEPSEIEAIYMAEVPDNLRIATKKDLIKAYEEVDGRPYQSYKRNLFDLADLESVRELLASKGFDGVSYTDISYENEKHKTIRIFDQKNVKMVKRLKADDPISLSINELIQLIIDKTEGLIYIPMKDRKKEVKYINQLIRDLDSKTKRKKLVADLTANLENEIERLEQNDIAFY